MANARLMLPELMHCMSYAIYYTHSRTILSRSMKLAASANAKQSYVIEMHNLGPPFICVFVCVQCTLVGWE